MERPAPVLAAVALLALLGAVGALRLEADAGTDQLVDSDSSTAVATEQFKDDFGDDPVAVLVRGPLDRLVLTSDITKLLALEGCLSGNAEGGQVFTDKPAPAPCAALAESKPARVVYGPATFLNQFAIQAGNLLTQQSQAATEQARQAAAVAVKRARRQGLSTDEQRAAGAAAANGVLSGFQQQIYELALRYGQTGLPRLDDPRFVQSVVFDPARPDQPKAKFSYLFPSNESALISIRLRPELSESDRRDAIDEIRAAVADPAFQIKGADYVVGGVPVVVSDLTDTLSSKVFVLLAIAVVVMAAALMAFVKPPLRLLPLGIALASAALTFGGVALFGGSLTLSSLAVLPVLMGLAVDYAIQFQARFGEARRGGSSPAAAAVAAAARGGTHIGTAALATSAGFLVLCFWPSPLIRSFGLLLLAGIAIAFVLTLTAGLAALSLTSPDRRSAVGRLAPLAARLSGVRQASAALALRLRGYAKRVVGASMTHSARFVAVGVIVAAGGWAASAGTDVNADVRTLLPSDLQALQDVDQLEQGTGVSGEVDVTVDAPDLTDPAVIAWMSDYKSRVLEDAGFDPAAGLCVEQDAEVCPSIALPDLFGSEEGTPSQSRIKQVLALLPGYFSQAVVTLDENGKPANTATIQFGIKVMPLDEQKRLIDSMRSQIDPPGTDSDPPEGVTAQVVGLPVLIADASSGLTRDRYLFTLYGILAVGLALLAVYRSLRRALVPLIPIVLATGWSSLAVWALGIELNPMSATLGALVIAIATEFSVLLAARYEEERSHAPLGTALRNAYSRTGTAVAASGVTAIAGFAVLAVSDIPLFRDFGLVTVLDLGVALASVMLVLPAVLVLAESRSPAPATAPLATGPLARDRRAP